MKATTILLALLLPICAFAEDVSAMAVPVNSFEVEVGYYNSNSDKDFVAVVRPAKIQIEQEITPDQPDLYSITKNSIFKRVRNSKDNSSIEVIAERQNSEKPVNWLKTQMADMDLNETDIVPVRRGGLPKARNVPDKLNFAFKSPISLTLPISKSSNIKAKYNCEPVLIAQGGTSFGNLWWISGNSPTLRKQVPRISCDIDTATEPEGVKEDRKHLDAYIQDTSARNNLAYLTVYFW